MGLVSVAEARLVTGRQSLIAVGRHGPEPDRVVQRRHPPLAQRRDHRRAQVSRLLFPLARHRETMLIRSRRGTRNLIVGALTAGILPLINTVGVAATNTLAAVIAWVGFGCVSPFYISPLNASFTWSFWHSHRQH